VDQGYHTDPSPTPQDAEDDPRLAVRRDTDRCFHRVEEQTPDGYIVEGVLFTRDEVAEVVELDEHGVPLPRCRPRPRP
jgi:hypothetical protein